MCVCEEVKARDQKRAADAVKHAAKGKRKPFGRKAGYKAKPKPQKQKKNFNKKINQNMNQ